MSGVIGHVTYALLAAEAALARRSPVGPIVSENLPEYLAGAYLGCDIQTLPEAVCVDTGEEVGYGTAPLKRSPVTGGPVKPWTLKVEGVDYSPYDIHRLFYGRAHLIFGWDQTERDRAVSWDELPHYFAAVVDDAMELFPNNQRTLAYIFGWVSHVVGDSLIKSIRPGVTLHLIDGKYTPRNRPIQDLVSFHQVGISELGIDWASLLNDLAETPVESIQPHYMRVARQQGRLAWDFPSAWKPDLESLLLKILAENRRYQAIRNRRILARLDLKGNIGHRQCSPELSSQTGGLTYPEMVTAAEKAGFRRALGQIAEQTADMFTRIVRLNTLL